MLKYIYIYIHCFIHNVNGHVMSGVRVLCVVLSERQGSYKLTCPARCHLVLLWLILFSQRQTNWAAFWIKLQLVLFELWVKLPLVLVVKLLTMRHCTIYISSGSPLAEFHLLLLNAKRLTMKCIKGQCEVCQLPEEQQCDALGIWAGH